MTTDSRSVTQKMLFWVLTLGGLKIEGRADKLQTDTRTASET